MSPSLNLRPAGYFGQGSIEIAAPTKPDEGGIRRLAINASALITQPAPGVDTLPDIIDYAAETHGTLKAMGWRDVLQVHEEKKMVKKVVGGEEREEEKRWTYLELSEYRFINYLELKEAVGEVARGFVELGIGKDDVLDMFAQTSMNWQLMSHACALISTTIATAYDTLGESGLTHSINEPKCIAIFTNPDLLPTLLKVLPNTPSLKFILYDGEPSPTTLEQLRAVRPDSIKTLNITDLRSLGRTKPLSSLTERRPNRETTACIMYTSGSTGAPKGVCLTHGNLVASVGAMHRVFAPHIPPGDTLITYLPLAHVLEYAVELCAIFAGVACGYARPRTLTDSGVRGCKGDLAALKPNVMFGVPGVWEGIRKGIVSEVEKGGWGMETAFGAAMRVKGVGVGKWVPGVDAVLDKFVFGRVKEVLGGNMRFAVNGGAGISMETQEFLNLAVVPLTQGYGLTESCGMCAFLPPEMLSFGPVGIPAPSIEIKLLDCPEMGYFSSTSDNSNSNSHSAGAAAHLPQGEICIRGPSVTEGYFNRPDLNGDEGIFTRDGWFRTGDVGQWNEDGTLSLVDRLKNLVKLPGGEYIALERLEAVYKSSNLISNLCVYVPENATQPIGIIQPHEQNLRHALRSSPSSTSDSGKDGDHSQSPYPELCASPGARQAVLESCNTLAKKNGFGRMEQLGGVVLVDEEWTTGNGMISAAGKVVRGKVGKRWGEGGKEGGK